MKGKLLYVLMVLTSVEIYGSLMSDILSQLEDIKLTSLFKSADVLKQNEQYPQLPNSFKIIQSLQATTAGGPCRSLFTCASCTAVQICRPTNDGNFEPFRNTTCPQQTPYCSTPTGTCTSSPDQFCGQPDDFVCPSDGYFPDATNCSIYHACNDLKSNSFICGSSNYNPDKSECIFNGSCSRANCSGLSGKKTQIGKTHYFAYCINGRPELVDRCPGNYNLNFTSQRCEPICSTSGIRTDYEDCTKYYKCSSVYINSNTSVLIRQHLSCTKDYAFDPSNFMCLPKNQTTCSK